MGATSKAGVSKLVQAWEAKNNERTKRAAGLGLMAVSLAACSTDDDVADSIDDLIGLLDRDGDGVQDGIDAFPDDPTRWATTSLTAEVDTVNGTSGSDTFNAGLTVNGVQTLQALDTINGGGGTDIINVTLNTSVNPNLTSVEVVNVNSTAVATLDLIASTGITTIANTGSTGLLTISNIGSGVTSISLANTSAGATFNFLPASVSGTADAKAFNISSVSGGTVTIDNAVETVTINSLGNANTLTALATGATTLNIAGSQDLTIGGTITSANVINASTATGAITLNSAHATLGATITTGSGADAITVTGGAVTTETVSLGAGNDTLTYLANLDDADILNGGAGTDTLAGISADLIALTTTTAAVTNISNFETVRVTNALGGNITLANIQAGINTLRLDAAAGANTITFEAGAKALDLRAAVGGNVIVADTGTAITDSLTITNNAAATDLWAGASSLTVNGFETVSFVTTGSGAAASQDFTTITLAEDTGGTSTLNLSGSNAVSTTGAITANVINASGLTAQASGTATFTMGAAAVGVTTITGSAGDDTLRGDASSTINAGAGDDIVTGGTGNDVLNGEAGDDLITTNAGTDTVDGGAGNDVVNVDGNLSVGDVIVGGAGTDTLRIDAAGTAATAVGVSGFEVLRVDTALTQDMVQFVNNQGFNTLSVAVAGAVVFNNVSDAVTTLRSTTTGGTATLTRLVDGTANALRVEVDADVAGVQAITVTADNEEMITLSSGTAATQDLTITALTAADLTSLVLTGAGDVTVTGAITSATGLATVDASSLVGAATVNASNSAVAVTMTAGAGGATFTGGIRADIINGGAGTDVLVGGAGNDVINGGAGADTITGGLGVDTLTGGAGVDTFVFTAADGVTVATADTITDFVSGTDRLDVQGTVFTVADGTAIVDFAAMSAAATVRFAAGDDAVAYYNALGTGNAYVFVNVDNDGDFDAADSLVILTGVNLVTELVGTDFI